jgi:hypothetical protein
MKNVTRRKAMKLAAAVGATLAAPALASAEEPKKSGSESESPAAEKRRSEKRPTGPLFAVVDLDGKLQRGQNVVAAMRPEVGRYEITFSREVRKGVFLVTIGGPGWDSKPLSAIPSVMTHARDPRTVVVYTQDLGGIRINSGFHLLVVTPETGA